MTEQQPDGIIGIQQHNILILQPSVEEIKQARDQWRFCPLPAVLYIRRNIWYKNKTKPKTQQK